MTSSYDGIVAKRPTPMLPLKQGIRSDLYDSLWHQKTTLNMMELSWGHIHID